MFSGLLHADADNESTCKKGGTVQKNNNPGARRLGTFAPGALPLAMAAVGGMLLVTRRLLRFVRVTGQSMRPVLADGDHVIALRTPPGRIRRGSLVVCRDPLEGRAATARARDAASGRVIELQPERLDYCLKRVVGMPGERVWPRAALVDPPPGADADGSVLVPPETFWLEGETTLSQDSTLWGPVPRERIVGVVIWSLTADRQRQPARRRPRAEHSSNRPPDLAKERP